uniref:Uncharacterized protein n=1 Tax=Aureoumbra lagunensis TaxID=44058 RepID=A0A7S3NN69_9STRA|mmetsp:Transcript_12213/g.18344  ORF Transcript_12213/g.18344 Transcript_12213/m.18344 type:complete len:364 (-) Transcript_12213:122-1213(-)
MYSKNVLPLFVLFMVFMLPTFNSWTIEKKSYSERRRLVFFAGLEGTGHHTLCKVLEPRCENDSTSNKLPCFEFDAKLQKGVSRLIRANDDSNKTKYENEIIKSLQRFSKDEKNREGIVDGPQMRILHFQCTSENTGFGLKLSYPDATIGKAMKSNHEGKVDAHLDLPFFVKLCERAGIDLRIIVVLRNPIDMIRSTAVHRHFGSIPVQTRILLTNLIVLLEQLKTVDPKFFCTIQYSSFIQPSSVSTIASFIGLLPKTKAIQKSKKKRNKSKIRQSNALSKNKTNMFTPFEKALFLNANRNHQSSGSPVSGAESALTQQITPAWANYITELFDPYINDPNNQFLFDDHQGSCPSLLSSTAVRW